MKLKHYGRGAQPLQVGRCSLSYVCNILLFLHSYTLSLFIDVPPAAATHRTRSPPPLTGLTSGGEEEVTKHPGIPVSSSPTSPRTHDHVVSFACLQTTMYMCIIPYSTTFLWVFSFTNFQPFAKLVQQTFLTHKAQSLRSDCKTIDRQHRAKHSESGRNTPQRDTFEVAISLLTAVSLSMVYTEDLQNHKRYL